MLEVVVRLRRRAEWITVHEGFEATNAGHFDDLHQRNAAAVEARRQLRAGGHLEEVEGDRAVTCTDHREAASPRERRDGGSERRVDARAIQDECRPDPSGELANLVRGFRT